MDRSQSSTKSTDSEVGGDVVITIEDDDKDCDQTPETAAAWFHENFTCPNALNESDFVKRASHLSKRIPKKNLQTTINLINYHMEFSDQLFALVNGECGTSIHLHELIGMVHRLGSDNNQHKHAYTLCVAFEKVCCGDQRVRQLSREDFKKVISTKEGIKSLFRVLKNSKSGLLTGREVVSKLDAVRCMERSAKWLSWFEYRFGDCSNKDTNIDFSTFKEMLQVKKSTFFAERFFKIFDKSHTGRVSTRNLLYGLNLLTHGSDEDKLRFLFDIYDINGNGHLERAELRVVMKTCLEENGVSCTETQIDDLTELLFQDADVEAGCAMNFENFKRQMQKHPDVVNNITTSAANWLRGPQDEQAGQKLSSRCKYTASYLRNHASFIAFFLFYVALNVSLFAEAAYRNYSTPPNISLVIAKGCGRSLNFNSAFIVVLMLRKCLTWLRPTRLGHVLPLDQHILIHKLVGCVLVCLSVVHTAAHLVNLDFQWSGNLPFVTGIVLVGLLVIIVVCSLPFVRRKGHFQVFYWTHQLFFVWWLCLLVHAATFWIWFLFPAMLYAMERVCRTKWSGKSHHGRTFIKEGNILPSKVVHLKIERPPHFRFKAGDYVYVNIPSIARHEWHPFTISSAPEQKGALDLHVRAVGNWTKKLYGYYKHKNPICADSTPTPKSEETKKENFAPVDLLLDVDVIDLELQDMDAASNLPNVVSDTQQQGRVSFGSSDGGAANGKNGTSPGTSRIVDVDFYRKSENETRTSEHAFGRDPRIKTISEFVHAKLGGRGHDLEVYLDGPYGSPSERICDSEHAVLVGAGIGVTPFASILQSINERYKAAKRSCPECKFAWKEEIQRSEMKLRKVDFFWINRDQKSFEWFVDLIGQLEDEQKDVGPNDDFLKFHLYMTSALHIQQYSGFGLEMALDLLHRRDRKDLITGLQSRTIPGRPDWDQVLQGIERERKGEVTIFYCGPPQLGHVLKRKSYQYGMKFKQEQF